MPLYNLVCIAQHYKTAYNPLRTLLASSATLVHEQGGNVRRMDSLGCKALPKRMRKDGEWHIEGDYWTMDFDANPRTVKTLDDMMRSDPRVLRWTTLKKGVTLPQISATPSFFASHASSSLRSSERPHLSQTMYFPTNEQLHIPSLAATVKEALNPLEKLQSQQEQDLLRRSPGERTRAQREAARRPQEASQRRSQAEQRL